MTLPQVPPRNDQSTDAFPKESGGFPTGRMVGDDHDIHSESRGESIKTLPQHPFRPSTRRSRHVIHRGRHPSGNCSVSHGPRIRLRLSALCAPYSTLKERADSGQCNPGPRPSGGNSPRYNSGLQQARGLTLAPFRMYINSSSASVSVPCAYLLTLIHLMGGSTRKSSKTRNIFTVVRCDESKFVALR